MSIDKKRMLHRGKTKQSESPVANIGLRTS
jgi:hypothetical protein